MESLTIIMPMQFKGWSKMMVVPNDAVGMHSKPERTIHFFATVWA